MVTAPHTDPPRKTALGIALMAVAMLVIPGADAIAKYLNASYSPLFLSWGRYAAALAFVLPVAAIVLARGRMPRLGWRALLSQLLRTAFLVAAMTLYYVAIADVPLADALGAYFVAPIVAMLLASALLREALDRRKLAAAVLGFAGALLVVRPGTQASAGMLLALASGCLMACYLVLTRVTAQATAPVLTLAIQVTLGTVLMTPLAILEWTVPEPDAIALILVSGALSAASNLLTIMAFRVAPVATLSPLVYLELVGATALGFLVFGDVPTVATWAGIAIIVAAGLSLVRRRG